MNVIFLIPAAILGFLSGAAFAAPSKKGLSMRKSPLHGVPLLKWEQFIAVLATSPKGQVSKRRQFGCFGMDARRLKDVGLMTEAHKGMVDGVPGVWMGTWVEPLTETKFLGSMPLQYAAFVKSMKDMAPKVSGLVGRTVEGGKQCSLSGLLGVSHMAGAAAVESWASDSRIRAEFPRTTEMFEKTNGIF